MLLTTSTLTCTPCHHPNTPTTYCHSHHNGPLPQQILSHLLSWQFQKPVSLAISICYCFGYLDNLLTYILDNIGVNGPKVLLPLTPQQPLNLELKTASHLTRILKTPHLGTLPQPVALACPPSSNLSSSHQLITVDSLISSMLQHFHNHISWTLTKTYHLRHLNFRPLSCHLPLHLTPST